jgi:hypothetical protein
MKCLITGCALIRESDEACLWGDLFEVGDCYVFNGTFFRQEPMWQYYPDNKIPSTLKTITVNGQYYFERRAVFVIEKGQATLNDQAALYISEGL